MKSIFIILLYNENKYKKKYTEKYNTWKKSYTKGFYKKGCYEKIKETKNERGSNFHKRANEF